MILNHGQAERGAGFCTDRDCTDYLKAIFLWNHGGNFKCPRCHKLGKKVMETGETENDSSLDFYQVRVEFDYRPDDDNYHGLAVLTDESMPKGNLYTFVSPLIKTEKRALQVCEHILGALLRADESIFKTGYIPRNESYNVEFDKPLSEVKDRLHEIGTTLSRSRLVLGDTPQDKR